VSKKHSIIDGGLHRDERGSIAFANDFNLSEVKRFYRITHSDTKTIRAWQGHKIEQKWFHCIDGSFEIYIAPIENWDIPSKELEFHKIILSNTNSQVLHIPGGYINGFRALENNSSLLVFSDKDLDDSKGDDFRFDIDYWFEWK